MYDIEKGPVEVGEDFSLVNENLPIPTNHQVPGLDNCSIISVSYEVQVQNSFQRQLNLCVFDFLY